MKKIFKLIPAFALFLPLATITQDQEEPKKTHKEIVQESAQKAIAKLLKLQKKDGSWFVNTLPHADINQNSIDVTSMAATSLLNYKESDWLDKDTKKKIKDAAKIALKFVVKKCANLGADAQKQMKQINKDKKNKTFRATAYNLSKFVWAPAYTLTFLSKYYKIAKDEKDEDTQYDIEDTADECVKALNEVQINKEGWNYYPITSNAFPSAAILIGLTDADEILKGDKLYKEVLESAAKFVAKARNQEGSFSYNFITADDGKKGFMGFNGEYYTKDKVKGLKVKTVVEKSAAEKAGLKLNDVISKFDGKHYKEIAKVTDYVRSKKAGDKIKITIFRKDEDKKYQEMELVIELGSLKDTEVLNAKWCCSRNSICEYAIWLQSKDKKDTSKSFESAEKFSKDHKRVDKYRKTLRPHEGEQSIAFYYWAFGYYYAGLAASSQKDEKGKKLLEEITATFIKFQDKDGAWRESKPDNNKESTSPYVTSFGLLLLSLNLQN